MKKLLASLAAGSLFGLGLGVSGAANPAVLLGFLDITGAWMPLTGLVIGLAVLLAVVAFSPWVRPKVPLLSAQYYLPSNRQVTAKLVVGSGLYGVGWGLSGFCLGPALVMAWVQPSWVSLYLVSLLGGMAAHDVSMRIISALKPAVQHLPDAVELPAK